MLLGQICIFEKNYMNYEDPEDFCINATGSYNSIFSFTASIGTTSM